MSYCFDCTYTREEILSALGIEEYLKKDQKCECGIPVCRHPSEKGKGKNCLSEDCGCLFAKNELGLKNNIYFIIKIQQSY